jgi:hypothetical protein
MHVRHNSWPHAQNADHPSVGVEWHTMQWFDCCSCEREVLMYARFNSRKNNSVCKLTIVSSDPEYLSSTSSSVCFNAAFSLCIRSSIFFTRCVSLFKSCNSFNSASSRTDCNVEASVAFASGDVCLDVVGFDGVGLDELGVVGLDTIGFGVVGLVNAVGCLINVGAVFGLDDSRRFGARAFCPDDVEAEGAFSLSSSSRPTKTEMSSSSVLVELY